MAVFSKSPFATLLLLSSLISGVAAQSPFLRPLFHSFEVATIKSTAPDWSSGRFIRMQSFHQFVARNHALLTLIAAAYNVSPKAISGGPAWVASEHFDILAKTPGEERPNLEEQMEMLRNLLAERFKLQFHREPKELPIFALDVAKNGPKLKPSTFAPDASPEGPPPLIFVVSPEIIRLPGRNATIAELASVMQRAALDRPVVDRTGITGRYDFDLEWAPDETQFGGIFRKGTNESKPGLFAAMQQQLGLRLEATKGLVDLFVIDQVERPSDN